MTPARFHEPARLWGLPRAGVNPAPAVYRSIQEVLRADFNEGESCRIYAAHTAWTIPDEGNKQVYPAYGTGRALSGSFCLAGDYRFKDAGGDGGLPGTFLAESARLAEFCAGGDPGVFSGLCRQFCDSGNDQCQPDNYLRASALRA